jgi:hypothetical protein
MPHRWRWPGWAPPAALLVLGTLLYVPQLLPGRAPGGGDFANYVLPYSIYAGQAWAAGRWPPLWNPDVFMGVPYLANLQASTLYPPYLAFALAPAALALAWIQALHVGLAGAGMYLYGLYGARLGRPGATVAAVIFMVGPYLTAQMAHNNLLYALAWTPWLMLAVARCVERPRWWLVAPIALILSMVVLAGHPQMAYFTGLLTAMAAAGPIWRRARRQRWAKLVQALVPVGLGVALGLGLAAAQLVPSAELVGQSIRSRGVDQALATDSPLFLRGLAGAILPHYSSELTAEITGTSLGAAALVLAVFAVLTRWRSGFVRGWLLVGLVAIWAATGHTGRLYDLLYLVLPGLSLFRSPARVLVFTQVALALLAGLGTRVALVRVRTRNPGPVLAAGGLALAPPVAVALYEALGSPDPRWLRLLPPAPGPPARDLILTGAFVAAVAAALVAAAAVPRLRAALAPALFGRVLMDTWLATQPIYSRHATSAAAYSPVGGARQLLPPPGPGSRFVSLSATDAGLQANQGMARGWLDADGYDGGVLPLSSYIAFRKPLLPPGSTNRADYRLPFLTHQLYSLDRLREMGVANVITADGADPNPGPCPCLELGDSAAGVQIWRVPDPLGRAWLETGGSRLPQRVEWDRGEQVRVDVDAPDAGVLVLADTDYPGWRAEMDGRPLALERQAGLLRAVRVPAGHHAVLFIYDPNSVKVGYAISLISLAALILLCLLTARRSRRPWLSATRA